jgi:predicted ribosome quality control (RQC) complex YloA/Tae2 family protein
MKNKYRIIETSQGFVAQEYDVFNREWFDCIVDYDERTAYFETAKEAEEDLKKVETEERAAEKARKEKAKKKEPKVVKEFKF